MSKYKQKTLFIFTIIVFFVFGYKNLEAGVVINEVQIKPTTGSFIELYNEGEDQDLTGWSIKRKTKNGTEYALVSETKFKGIVIKNNSMLLLSIDGNTITDFVPDILWAKSNILAQDNSVHLYNKDGIEVGILGWGSNLNCISLCPSNPPENKSVQRINDDNWIIANPTPGQENYSSSSSSEEESSTEDNSSSSSSSSSLRVEKKKEILNPYITTKIIVPKIVIANVPFTINHETIGYKNEKIIFGRFVWNFGDGRKEEMEPCLPFDYVYQYPGDYALSLSYYDTDFSIVPEATNRVIVKVISSGINIASIGTVNDPYIELENNSNNEMVLNKWSIVGTNHTFVVPDGMIILPNKKIKLSSKITGFNFEDLSSLVIMDDKGVVFATYPKAKNIKTTENKYSIVSTDKKYKEVNNTTEEGKKIIDLNNLKSSSYDSSREVGNGIIYFGLFSIIALGITTVLLIRKDKKTQEGNSENLSADDIKIME